MDTKFIVISVIVAVVFAILWRKGQLLRLSAYVGETREELKKCAWPTKDELIGSTLVVIVSILALGLFTVGIDLVIALVVSGISR